MICNSHDNCPLKSCSAYDQTEPQIVLVYLPGCCKMFCTNNWLVFPNVLLLQNLTAFRPYSKNQHLATFPWAFNKALYSTVVFTNSNYFFNEKYKKS